MSHPFNAPSSFGLPRKLEDHLYLLERPNESGPLLPVPAVLVDGTEMVLFGVGQQGDFPRIVAQLQSLLPLDRLRYVVAPGMERHLPSTMLAFREAGANPCFVVDEKLDRLMNLSARGMTLKCVAKEETVLVLDSGRILRFLPTPFVISSMAFATFDETAKVLFSHYLFDVAEPTPSGADLAERIRQTLDFCVNYVPSSDFLRPALQKVAESDVRLVITQSGMVLDRPALSAYLEAMMKWEFFNQNLGFTQRDDQGNPDYRGACHQILQKWKGLYGLQELRDAIPASAFPIDWDSLRIDSEEDGPEVLDALLDAVRHSRGLRWLLAVEPLIGQLRSTTGIRMPEVFQTILGESERRIEAIGEEKSALESQVASLERSLKETLEKMTKDPHTGYYNEVFLRQHLDKRLRSQKAPGMPDADVQLYFIQIDNIQAINAKYTPKIGDETIRNLGYLLDEVIRPQDLLVKRNGPGFIVLVADDSERDPSQFARTIQNAAKNSESFLEPITISVAVVRSKELGAAPDVMADRMMTLGENRIKSAARKTGVFIDETTPIDKNKYGRILIADGEEINLRLMESLFFNENFDVKTAKDGLAAWEMAIDAPFDAIIAERTIPKMDGMLLKQNLNQSTPNANTPFWLLTYNKTADIVRRANQLGIDLVIQKPVLFEELIGQIRRAMKKGGN